MNDIYFTLNTSIENDSFRALRNVMKQAETPEDHADLKLLERLHNYRCMYPTANVTVSIDVLDIINKWN